MTSLAERDEKIVRLRQEDKTLTLEVIGDRFSLTRERVRQIVSKAGLVYERPQVRRCLQCGKRLYAGNLSGYCQACLVQIHAEARPWYTCEACGTQFQPKRPHDKRAAFRFHSWACRDAAKKGQPLGRWKLVPYKLEGWVPREEMPSPFRGTHDPALTEWANAIAERQEQMIKLIVDSRKEATNIASNWRLVVKKRGRYGITRTVPENGKFTVYLGAAPVDA